MNTSYIYKDRNRFTVQGRREIRDAAIRHLNALGDTFAAGHYKPTSEDFIPSTEDGRGFLHVKFSNVEALRFYLSPGGGLGELVADKIDFEYHDQDTGTTVLLDVSREDWAQQIYRTMKETGRVDLQIAKHQLGI